MLVQCRPCPCRPVSRTRCVAIRAVAQRPLRARANQQTALRDVSARWSTGPSTEICPNGDCIPEEDGAVLVRDDLADLLQVLPEDIREPLVNHPQRSELLEVVLDLGRRPEARFLGRPGGEYLRAEEVTSDDLTAAALAVGEFGGDNRAGVTGTLHRISCMRNRKGAIIGLTCRVGRAVTGHTDMIRDLVESGHSVLLLGRPGVGKTTVIRELARVLADELSRRVVIVDSSNEIGGDGDVPHPAIGGARRMQVPDIDKQHMVMIEAVENHMPQVVIVDEIGTEAEALACRTIAERGVTLIGTAHGRLIENLIKNPTLSDLVGGIQSVTLGDEEAAKRGTQKSILERKAPPTFPIVVEIRERALYVAHWTQDSVDAMLQGRSPRVQVRERDPVSRGLKTSEVPYSVTLESEVGEKALGRSVYDADYDSALKRQQALATAAVPAADAAPAPSPAGTGLTSASDLAARNEAALASLMAMSRRASLSGSLSGARVPAFVGAAPGGKGGNGGGKRANKGRASK